jgi:hypothetical protein
MHDDEMTTADWAMRALGGAQQSYQFFGILEGFETVPDGWGGHVFIFEDGSAILDNETGYGPAYFGEAEHRGGRLAGTPHGWTWDGAGRVCPHCEEEEM